MCGVAGFQCVSDVRSALPDIRHRRKLLVEVLFRENCARGTDSWGYYLPRADVLVRGLGPAHRGHQLSANRAWRREKAKIPLRTSVSALPSYQRIAKHGSALLHTRFATAGAVTVENAHPFDLGDMVGQHNGVIYNHDELNRKYGEEVVDSRHIFRAFRENRRDLKDFEGYGAIQWVEKNDPHSIYLATFGSAELTVYRVKDFGVVWSSEARHLQAALDAAGLVADQEYAITRGQVYRILNGKMYIAGSHPKIDVREKLWGKGADTDWWLETHGYGRYTPARGGGNHVGSRRRGQVQLYDSVTKQWRDASDHELWNARDADLRFTDARSATKTDGADKTKAGGADKTDKTETTALVKSQGQGNPRRLGEPHEERLVYTHALVKSTPGLSADDLAHFPLGDLVELAEMDNPIDRMAFVVDELCNEGIEVMSDPSRLYEMLDDVKYTDATEHFDAIDAIIDTHREAALDAALDADTTHTSD